MMGISDRIEAFILELLKQEQEDRLKIQRNELAQLFGCVPSQINYVISTRFSPERGYIVESRRGGGGYVTIRKIPQSCDMLRIGSEISEADAALVIDSLAGAGITDGKTASVIGAALSDEALISAANADKIRADIIKSILKVL